MTYDYPALLAWRANVSGENRPKYDLNVEYVKLNEQVGTNLINAYQKAKRVATVSSRDVYQDCFSNHYPDGMIRTILYDDPENDYPITKGVVRMKVPIAGFEFIPDPNDPNKCSCRQIIECGLGGYIPSYVTS